MYSIIIEWLDKLVNIKLIRRKIYVVCVRKYFFLFIVCKFVGLWFENMRCFFFEILNCILNIIIMYVSDVVMKSVNGLN